MSEHHASISWRRDGAAFDYDSYPRDHRWTIGPVDIDASAAPEYLGSENRVDPEQAFVASLASCHMLTFLAIAARRKLQVDAYEDSAVGHLEKNPEGALALTRVELYPNVTFTAPAKIDDKLLMTLHDKAHRSCFIANSVKTEVIVHSPPAN